MEYCYVETRFGKIKGLEDEQGRVFKSVPYAVTERFTDPKPVEPWGEFDATRLQVNCYQRFAFVDEAAEQGFYYKEFDFTRESDWAESPMTMTIKTPKQPKKCPVVLYFHGGSFENGCIDDVPFGTSREYCQRGIILISVGYRLNVFGLYDSNNFGLRDMVYAVNWVKDNIADFGGDPDHIVLMGQSAGAMCVNDLLLDNDLKGIVKGAIMMSGAGVLPRFAGPGTRENNHQFWLDVMKAAGCENEEQLKKVDPQILWKAWYDTKQTTTNMQVSSPAIDGQVIKDVPQNILARNEDLDVPLLVGVTSQDMFPFMIFDLAYSSAKRNIRQNRSNVYGYFFDRELPGKAFKAFHASDLWYMFGCLDISWRPFEDYDRQLSKQMIDYAANFIKTFDPNGADLPKWPKLDRRNRKFRWFGQPGKELISPMNCRRKLYNSMFFDKGPF